MDVWIILNGEKTGPLRDFEVRRKIEDGALQPTTPAWYEGLPKWQPLGEMDLFQREFTLHTPPAVVAETSVEIPALAPATTYYGRRFWARWFDLCLYSGIWWLAIWAAGRDIGATLMNPWLMIFHFVPWFVLETILIHHLGTTPGKWLLGLRVYNLDRSQITLTQSLKRSARVLFSGIGFGWSLLAIFCQILSFITAKRLGKPLWDIAGRHQVSAVPLDPRRIIFLVSLLVLSLYLQLAVQGPFIIQTMIDNYPEPKPKIESFPTGWTLPKRS